MLTAITVLLHSVTTMANGNNPRIDKHGIMADREPSEDYQTGRNLTEGVGRQPNILVLHHAGQGISYLLQIERIKKH